jgi:hypothetical protein
MSGPASSRTAAAGLGRGAPPLPPPAAVRAVAPPARPPQRQRAPEPKPAPRLPPPPPAPAPPFDRREGDALKARALAAQSARELLDVMRGGEQQEATGSIGGLPLPPPRPTPPPPPHAVAVLAVRLAQLADLNAHQEDDEQQQLLESAERELCDLLRASAPRMQFQNVAGAMGALGRLAAAAAAAAASRTSSNGRRRPAAGRRREDDDGEGHHHRRFYLRRLRRLDQAAAVMAARLAECPVSREARGDAGPRAGFWLARAAVGLARLRRWRQAGPPSSSSSSSRRAWARIAALSGALAPRLSAAEVGAVCWALGRSRRGGEEEEDGDDDQGGDAAAADDDDQGGGSGVLEFALDALAARAAELAGGDDAMTSADLCCTLVGLARCCSFSSSSPPPPGVAAALPALVLRAQALAARGRMEPRHAVGVAFALARLERALPRRRGRLASGASAETVAVLVLASAASASAGGGGAVVILTPHEACVLAWSAASLASRGIRVESRRAEAWTAVARRALVSACLPVVVVAEEQGGASPRAAAALAPHDAGMLASALALVGGGANTQGVLDAAQGQRLATAVASGLLLAAREEEEEEGDSGGSGASSSSLPLRTAVTALWALTRGVWRTQDDQQEVALKISDAVSSALLPRCERALREAASAPASAAAASAASAKTAPPLPTRELVVLAIALSRLLGGDAAPAVRQQALRCLELLCPWLQAGCRRMAARELAAVAWSAGMAAREAGGGDDDGSSWPLALFSSAAAALAPLMTTATNNKTSATPWDAARVMWAAAAVGKRGGQQGEAAPGALAACCRRLLAALRSPDERVGAGTVSRAAWALAAVEEQEQQGAGLGGGGSGSGQQRRRRRALARALAARANVLLALGEQHRPAGAGAGAAAASLAPELVVTQADAARMRRAFKVLRDVAVKAAAEAEEEQEEERGRPLEAAAAGRSASRSRSRSRRRAVLDSPVFWGRMERASAREAEG